MWEERIETDTLLCTYDLGRILVAHWTFMFLRCMRKRSATGIMCMFELHSLYVMGNIGYGHGLPFSDTLRQFAMVFVSIIHDAQLCTVSIHMQGVPSAFGLRQPGSTCLQAGAQDCLDYLGQNAFQQTPWQLHSVS